MNFNRLRDSSATRLARAGGFYLSAVAFVAILVLFLGGVLLFPITAWFDPAAAGTHFVHDVTFLWMLLIAGAAMLIQLYRPAERVAAMQIALLIAAFTLITNLVTGSFEPTLVAFLGPIAVAAALHPARRKLFSFGALAEGTENRLLLALAGAALVPVAVYAAAELTLQATVLDDHAQFGHYSGMATFVLTFVTLAALAAVSGVGHRLAAYVAGLMAVLLAVSSLFQPTVSAIDGTWSVLAILWSVAVVVAFEWSVRSADVPGTSHGAEEASVDTLDEETVPR